MLDLAQANSAYPENPDFETKLAAVIEVNGLRNQKVIAAGSSEDVNCIDLKLPQMPEKELKLVVRKNLEEILNRPAGQLTFDYRILEESEGQLIIKAYYSDLTKTTRLMDSIIAAHLVPTALSAAHLAIAEMLNFNRYTEPGKVYVQVEFGESCTSTSLIADQEVVSLHSQPIGFGSINRAIMNELKCSYEQAEEYKRHLHDLEAVKDPKIARVLEEAYVQILEAIRATIEYFQEQNTGVAISEMLLTGGGSAYGLAPQILADHFGTPATRVDPFRRIITLNQNTGGEFASAVTELAPCMAVAVGLALGGIDW